MSIVFSNLQSIYNQQIDSILASDGLTTQCSLVFGISKKDVCPNCIFDSQTNKSSNKYRLGGPVPFDSNRVCPYCHGIGFYGQENTEEDLYLAVIWDSKKWLNLSTNIKYPDNTIQTMCHHSLLSKIKSANYLVIKNQKYQMYGKPHYIGLGDNNYIAIYWEQIA